MFSQRLGHGKINRNEDQTSPIFLQFLDCVSQLLHIFPTAFEFNDEFLVALMDAVISCQFINFIHDCERPRMFTLEPEYPSFWRFVCTHKARFRNASYARADSVLTLTDSLSIRLWRGWFLRWYGERQAQNEPELVADASLGSAMETYTVLMKTGKKLMSGTDAQVAVHGVPRGDGRQVYVVFEWDDDNQSKEIALTSSKTHWNKFERGRTDEFIIPVLTTGALRALYVGHDGKGMNSNWFLDHAEVRTTRGVLQFRFNRWIVGSDGWTKELPV